MKLLANGACLNCSFVYMSQSALQHFNLHQKVKPFKQVLPLTQVLLLYNSEMHSVQLLKMICPFVALVRLSSLHMPPSHP